MFMVIKPSLLSCVLCPMSHVLCPMSYVLCPMSHVPCPMSHVPCPMSHVLCPMSHILCLMSKSGEDLSKLYNLTLSSELDFKVTLTCSEVILNSGQVPIYHDLFSDNTEKIEA